MQSRRAENRWWMALLIYVAIGLFAAYRYAGPGPQPLDATGVSSSRALQTLDMLLGPEQKPHRAGSKENELVRVRLLGALDELSAKTWQQTIEPPPGRDPIKLGKLGKDEKLESPLINIVARLDGRPRARPVVLATHYDSCRNCAGAGDAGQCVAAILETLRHLKQQPLEYELWCLFTDGEEFGLWGGYDFVKQADYPWGDQTPVVINFDARGNRGAVLLYETHTNNLRAMQIAAGGIAAPKISTSLMAGVYKRLPNGTDFTEFLRGGWCGWNLAVVAGAENYHTPDDTIENLSARSIQHFASHANGLLRRLDLLSDSELTNIDRSEPAVFFDLLGLGLVVYSASWNGWHVLLNVLLILVAWRSARPRGTRVLLVAVMSLAIVVLGAGAGWLITYLMRMAGILPRNFVSYGELWALIYPVAAAAIVGITARGLVDRLARSEVFLGLAVWYLILGAATNMVLPGAAYLLLWPAFFLAIAALGEQYVVRSHRWNPRWGIMACVMPAILYAPTYVLLAQTLGPRAGMVITGAVVMMLLPSLAAWAAAPVASAPLPSAESPIESHDQLSQSVPVH